MGMALKPKRLIILFSLFSLFFLLPFPTSAAASLTEITTMSEVDGVGDTDDYYGFPVDSGDLNGDGYEDLVVGFNALDTAGGNTNGGVFVYFGGSGADNTADVILLGEVNNSVCPLDNGLTVGDINGDGNQDLIIGATMPSASNAGKVFIFFGPLTLTGTHSVTEADESITGSGANSFFATVSTGDFNGDEIDDLVVGAYMESSTAGKIYLYYGGSSFDTSADLTFSVSGSLTFGLILSLKWDLNQDGFNDLIAFEHYALNGLTYVFYGNSGSDVTYDVKFSSAASGDYRRAVVVNDVNNDGYNDICFGDYKNDTDGTNFGRVYCWYGGTGADPLCGGSQCSKAASSADLILSGSAENDNFGRTIWVDDLNNDGYQDLMVGATQSDAGSGSRHGKFFAYFGVSSSFDSTADISIIKTSGNANFGNFVHSFDWDGDNWRNVAIVSGGTAGSGSGDPVVNLYEITHGSPSISVNGLGNINNSTPTLSGTATDTGVNVGGVQYSVDSGSWTDCSASDGSFNSSSENFTCTLTSLSDGSHSVRVRSEDANEIYMLSSSYGTDSFTIDTSLPGPFDLISPGHEEYTQDTRPVFKWKAASTPDTGTGLSHYKLEVLYENGGGFIVDGIPSSGTSSHETEKYIIRYEGFSDSDSTNNYISLQTKSSSSWGEKNGELQSGRNNWSVRATDHAGNEREQSRIVYLGVSPNLTITPTPIPTTTLTTRKIVPTPTVTPTPVITPTPYLTPSPTPTLTPRAFIPPLLSRLETKTLEVKVLKEEKVLAETKEEKEKIKKEGHVVQIRVLDNQGLPLKGIKVILHSEPKEAFTDEEGIATFRSVEPGEHKVLIAYGNQEAEQGLNLEGEVLEFHYDLEVREVGPSLTKTIALGMGLGSAVSLVMIVLLILRRKRLTSVKN